VDAHAAIDVAADGLRDDEAFSGHHGANGHAGGLVEIGRDGDLRNAGRNGEGIGLDLGQAGDRVAHFEQA